MATTSLSKTKRFSLRHHQGCFQPSRLVDGNHSHANGPFRHPMDLTNRVSRTKTQKGLGNWEESPEPNDSLYSDIYFFR
jgi:hypothetical protein